MKKTLICSIDMFAWCTSSMWSLIQMKSLMCVVYSMKNIKWNHLSKYPRTSNITGMLTIRYNAENDEISMTNLSSQNEPIERSCGCFNVQTCKTALSKSKFSNISTVTWMLATDVGDQMCWWQVGDVGDRYIIYIE